MGAAAPALLRATRGPVLAGPDRDRRRGQQESEKFIPKLKLKAEIVPAKLLNTAGIVGAAWLAADRQIHPDEL